MVTPRRVTLNDVAAASGVSRATAGFVLANDPNQTISAATRDRVHAAARELGYVPNGVARALREGSSRVVVLEIDWVYDGNYARSYIRGLDAELTAHEYTLLVRHGPSSRKATEQVLHAITPRAILRFAEPYISGEDVVDSGGGWRDGLAAHVALQLQYLVEHGHERIALALPTAHSPLSDARQRLTVQHAKALKLPPPQCLDIPGTREAAAVAVEEFRRQHPQVTAIAAFNDDVALRAVCALHDLGLAVPGDVAVIGFDDNGSGALVTPPITSLYIDAEVHGRRSARSVLGLDADDLSPNPGRIVERASV